jgi:Fur family peroxide stress response transcriptional regulator
MMMIAPVPSRPKDRRRYVDRRVAAFAARCRVRGLAVTPQRLAVIRALLATAEHPRAEDVYAEVRKQHPHISLATIHRTLETLTQVGEARKVTPLHDSARYDGNIEPHHHLVCVRCRRVTDIDAPEFNGLLHGRRSVGDFTVLGCSVEIQAICKDCQKQRVREEGESSCKISKEPRHTRI